MTTVRRAFGPLLTTGVALAAAGVVVANPVIAPRGDVRIPAVQLSSGSGDAASMLDDGFLDAIAPASSESTGPLSVLKDLFSSLAADATHIGKNAIVSAFIAGMAAVSDPELTATTGTVAGPSEIAAIAPPADLPDLSGILAMPEFNLGSVFPDYINDAPVPVGVLSALPDYSTLPTVPTVLTVPTVKDFAQSLAFDAGYLGKQVIAAAFATGALVAYEPAMIVDTLRSLVTGDFRGALEKVVKVVVAPLGPPAIVFDAVNNVIRNYLPEWNIPSVAPGTPNGVPSVPDTGGSEDAGSSGPSVARSHSEVLASAAVRSDVSPRAARSLPVGTEESATDSESALPSVATAREDAHEDAEVTPAVAETQDVTATEQAAAADVAASDTQAGATEATRPAERTGAASRVAVARDSHEGARDNARAHAGQRSKAKSAAAAAGE